jgi:hypothetical protein
MKYNLKRTVKWWMHYLETFNSYIAGDNTRPRRKRDIRIGTWTHKLIRDLRIEFQGRRYL